VEPVATADADAGPFEDVLYEPYPELDLTSRLLEADARAVHAVVFEQLVRVGVRREVEEGIIAEDAA
jgi:hypothetical protein